MNNLYYEIFHKTDDCVVLFDKSGKIIDSSEKFDSLFDGQLLRENKGNVLEILVNYETIDLFINTIESNSTDYYKFRSNLEIIEATVELQSIDKIFLLKIFPTDTKSKISLNKTFYNLIDSFQDPIFVYDTNNFIVYVNKAFGIFHGLPRKEIIGKHITQLYPTEIAESFIKNNDHVKSLSIPYQNESYVSNHNGELITASTLLLPIKDEDQTTVVGVIGTAHNISKQKKLEKSNIQQEQNLLLMNEIVQNAPIVIFYSDTKNILRYTNKNISSYINKIPDEILGKTIAEILDQPLVEKISKINAEIFKNKRPITYTHDVVIDGKRVVSEITKTPFFNKDGNLIGIIGTATDRTQEHILEEKLVENQRLESLSILAGGFAHDFNNILAGIRGYTDLLLFQETQSTKIQFLTKMNSSISRASELTKRLLEIGKQGMNDKKPVNINEIVSEVVNIVRFSTTKNIIFRENVTNDPFKLIGDSGQIFQLIMNLIINGIDAIEKEGIIEIITKNIENDNAQSLDKRYLYLEIKDSGKGIEKSIQSQIFNPFFTTKMHDATKSGSGLGLTTVYRIVKNHNGEINLESTLNKGTSFKIQFPIENSEKFTSDLTANLIKGTGGILIIDDNQEILEVLNEFLTNLGYDIFVADSGFKGIEMYKNHLSAISLVILNYIMPEINGINVYSILKTINPDIKILMMTGYLNSSDYLNGLDCEGIIQKPLDLANLSKKLQAILN